MTGLSNYAFVEFYTTDDAVNWMEANKVESVILYMYMFRTSSLFLFLHCFFIVCFFPMVLCL